MVLLYPILNTNILQAKKQYKTISFSEMKFLDINKWTHLVLVPIGLQFKPLVCKLRSGGANLAR